MDLLSNKKQFIRLALYSYFFQKITKLNIKSLVLF